MLGGLLRALGRTAAQHSLFSQALATQLGIGPTDLECLLLLRDLGPATAGQLADVLGLTTGAITGVVDRLAAVGFVVRESDPADRRRVIVRHVPERAEQLDEALAPLLVSLARSLDGFSQADLGVVAEFQARARQVLEAETARLRAEQSGASAVSTAPLGGVREGSLEFTNGVSGVRIAAGEFADDLYRASFEGAQPTLRTQGGNLSVRYRRMGPFEWSGAKHSGLVALSATIPWRISVHGGASAASVDARGLQLRELRVDGGASRFDVWLPLPAGSVCVCLEGGLNRVQIQRPAGVPLQLQVQGGANRLEYDDQRFGAVGGDVRLASPGWEAAADRYCVEVRGGASRLTVQEFEEVPVRA